MKNNKRNHKKKLILKILISNILLASGQLHELELMPDEALRAVDGQEGVHIATTLTELNVDQLYWQDDAGRGSTTSNGTSLSASFENLKLRQSNASLTALGTDITINTGSQDDKVALDLAVRISPALITVDSFRICETASSASCTASMGDLAIQSNSPLELKLRTTDGLFNSGGLSEISLGLTNANIYLGQTDVHSKINQLILKNFNFNFAGRGAIFVDSAEGLRLQTNTRTGTTDNKASLSTTPNSTHGYVDLNRVTDSASANAGFLNTGTYAENGVTTSSGLNLEIMLNKEVDSQNLYAINPLDNAPKGAKGLIRLGASGRMVNSSLTFRGLKGQENVLANAVSPDGTQTNNKVMGESGIGFRIQTEFTKDDDSMLSGDKSKATKLEIGGAGLNAYGFEFSHLTGLMPGTRAAYDSGNVYINLVDTQSLLLPVNSVFQSSRFGNGHFLTTDPDYKQNVHFGSTGTNPYALAVAIRGGEFQTFSRRGRFTTSAGMQAANLFSNDGLNNQWGLALPFYNLNANLALYGTRVSADQAFYYTLAGSDVVRNLVATAGETARLGLSVAMSTEGVDKASGVKTTSLLLLDGSKVGTTNSTTDYYMGLRNIDLLLKGAGSLGVEKGHLNLSLRDMLIVMSAEVAGGYLPGTTYKTCKLSSSAAGCTTQSSALSNSFALADDVLLGLKLRLGGDVDFSLIPHSSVADGSRLTVAGEVELKGDSNTIQISDPQNGSTLGLDRIIGKVAFNNAIVVNKDQATHNAMVGFHTNFLINPQQSTTGVFRARDINFYPPNTGPGARLGELAITGGRISSEFQIIPRN